MESKSGGGFNENICSIEGLEKFAGYFVKVYAQNENYAVKKVDSNGEVLEVLATIPDIISVINLETSTVQIKIKFPLRIRRTLVVLSVG